MTNDSGGYQKHDEPLPYGSPVDYRYELQILTKLRDDERDRLDRIESKIAVVIAGTFAALAFSLEKAGSEYQAIAAALYIVPLVILLVGLIPVHYGDAPDPKNLHETFSWYPVSALSAACGAIVKVLESNHPKIKRKASMLRVGIWALIVVTCLFIGTKLQGAFHPIKGSTNVRTPYTEPERRVGNRVQSHAHAAARAHP